MEKVNINKALESLKDYLGSYDQQSGYQSYSTETFVHDVLYGLGIAIDKDKYHAAQGYKKFKLALNDLIAMDKWTSVAVEPSDELLNKDGWGKFLTYSPNEDRIKHRVYIYSKPHGWNMDGISHWRPLNEPKD